MKEKRKIMDFQNGKLIIRDKYNMAYLVKVKVVGQSFHAVKVVFMPTHQVH